MSIPYNLTGAARKALVQTISEILGKPAVYQGAPTFAYAIDFYSVDKNGTLIYPDDADMVAVRRLINSLSERGYQSTEALDDPNTFTVELPRAGFSATALDNLQKIIVSKAELFKRALGTDTVDVEVLEDKLRFPWFTLHGLEGEVDAFTKLIVGICDMAKRQKRVVARERTITNDKFTMRVFLIRLGFIGPEYQAARTLLLRNLTGNSSWLAGPPPERRSRRRNRKRLPPPPPMTLPFAKGCNLLEGLATWLTSSGTILSDEQRSNEYNGVRIVTVRWQNQNYRIIQVDGVTSQIEQA